MFSSQPHNLFRRDVLQLGALGAFGVGLPGLLQCRSARASTGRAESLLRPGFGKAKSCILLFHFGGAPTQDMFDMKPDAPLEIRGEFRPVSTTVPSFQICEHLPQIAKQAQRIAVIRSVNHDDTQHNNSGYATLTGHKHDQLPNTVAALVGPKPDDHPSYGAVLVKQRNSSLPWVSLPYEMINGPPYPGQTAGFLGARYGPLWLKAERPSGKFVFRDMELPSDVGRVRADRRRKLWIALDEQGLSPQIGRGPSTDMTVYQTRAIDLLAADATRTAFQLDHEKPGVRDQYGRNMFGNSCLLSRRLVEAGIPLVALYTMGTDGLPGAGGESWDTHHNNFRSLKKAILPIQDPGYAMLLEDLAQRGLLDETLVVWFGEFGRTPKVNGNAGRDHWPFVYSVLFAGGGVQGGIQFGASDKNAAYPATDPVSLQDVAATIYHCLGIEPDTGIPDRQGRFVEISCGGMPLLPILA
jgi:hypothetical protein